MKHVFTIHSSLTFLVAYTIIKQLNLPKEDVVIISSKYNALNTEYRVVSSYAECYNKWWHKIVKMNLPVNYDKYIQSLTNGDEFTAYVDLMSTYQRILITNHRCKRFHFMEEGNSAYMAEDNIDDLTWEGLFRNMTFREKLYYGKSFYTSLLRILRGYNYRLLQVPYHYMAYVNFKDLNFYGFSKNAFFNAPAHKKKILYPDKDDPVINEFSKGLSLDNAIIWIDGSNKRFTQLNDSYYHAAIDKAINVFIRNNDVDILQRRVYIKLKPGLENTKGIYLAEALKKYEIKFTILPGDINLECLFIRSNNCIVIGVLTAALEYAHVFGHNAISIYPLFSKRPPTFFDRMDGVWSHMNYFNKK